MFFNSPHVITPNALWQNHCLEQKQKQFHKSQEDFLYYYKSVTPNSVL